MKESSGRRPFALAFALSALVHAVAFTLIPVPEGRALPPVDAPIEIALLRPEAPPPDRPRPQQMVAPPDTINDRPPDQPRFESDRDNTVEQETVHTGVPNPEREVPASKPIPAEHAPSAARPAPPHSRDTSRPRAEPEHLPATPELFASTDELVRAQQAEPAKPEPDEQPGSGRRRLALAVPPVAPEWSLPGDRGTLDHLPDIQRGNVTLLNTKANVFSPFVRRVGERVFQHLIIRQRRLELQQILNAHHPVQMRAVLDARGKLKSVSIEGQSGSATMDDTLGDALNSAAFDNNPPRAAANASGDFEFVFQAQLNAVQPGAGGAPSRIESRLSVALL